MISLNDATVYIEAGHSCERGYRVPLSESPSLFFRPFFFSFLFPYLKRAGILARLCRPLSRNRPYEREALLQRSSFDVIFCVKETDKFDATYFSFPPPGIF